MKSSAIGNNPATDDIREEFLRFFEKRDHRRVRSSSLVPDKDPTLLFTNAGMNRFKDVFLGREKPDYRRAVSSQKCMRAGGKHNDLEVVGFTGRHHTFFEMLGNFSFGDYFKSEAISFAWEFLIDVIQLPREKLIVSVYKDDDEAAELWKKNTGISEERIFRLGEKDNFWQMGDTGPCGPCSEIHYDQGDLCCSRDVCSGIECECGRFVEIWNLVFMQYNRDSEGKLHPLPGPSIDTGMGLERLSAVVSGSAENYGIDLFQELIKTVAGISGIKPRMDDRSAAGTRSGEYQKSQSGTASGEYQKSQSGTASGEYQKSQSDAEKSGREKIISCRVVADHARAASFLIADGVMPSPEGRGYVLRRIMRRAIRHGKKLGIEELFFSEVCNRVVELMGGVYPELMEQRAFIEKVSIQEETSFRRTLDRGLGLLEDSIEGAGNKVLPGETAFRLYDTYGFPLDLTRVICHEKGLDVDEEGFEQCLEKRRTSSSWAGFGEDAQEIYMKIAESSGETVFTGYENHQDEGKILVLLKDGAIVDGASEGDEIEIITDRTPFYGESGGQVGDTGRMIAEGVVIDIKDTIKSSGIHVHRGRVREGNVRNGIMVEQKIDSGRRKEIEANHSATHLLHNALRDVLGDHVKQAGSLVAPDFLRFDYAAFEAPSREELEKVEIIVNEMVMENDPTELQETDFDNARRMGAVAIFGEKYGEKVRVAKIGGKTLELCGGTHVSHSGDIGLFRIVSDASIASGIRRITAYTGKKALIHSQEESGIIHRLGRILKSSPSGLERKTEQILSRQKELEKEVELISRKMAIQSSDEMDVQEVNGIKVLAVKTELTDMKAIRDLADSMRGRIGEGLVVLGAEKDGKAILLAAVTPKMTDRVRASDIIRSIAGLVGGRGGGKADMAQAGGDNPAGIDNALAEAVNQVRKL